MNWHSDDTFAYEGTYSIKSGTISDNQQSSISINLDVIEDSQISFYKKVSCEATGSITGNYYDYLAFLIDGIEVDKWAGEIDWTLETFPVEIGTHTFEWLFIKDGGVTSGSDAVWIDFIVFNILDVVILVNQILT